MTASSTVYWSSASDSFPLDGQQSQQQGYTQQQQTSGYTYGSIPHPQMQQSGQQSHHTQLQLEHHLDALSSFSPSFNHSAYSGQTPAALPQAVPSGAAVMSSQTNTHKYTGTTTSPLSTGSNIPSGAFIFGQQGAQSIGRGEPNATSPEETFGGFQFNNGPGSGRSREGVPPHERLPHTQQQILQSPPQPLAPHSQAAGYLHPSGYTPQHTPYSHTPAQKRRRGEAGSPGASGWSGSGTGSGGEGDDDDPEHDDSAYDDYGAEYGASPEFHGNYGAGASGAGYAHGYNSSGIGQQQQGFPFDAANGPYGAAQQHQQYLLGDGLGGAGAGPGQAGSLGPDGRPKQTHRAACVRCKNLKVRCEFPPDAHILGDAAVCRRCSNGNHKCEIPGRKKRKQPPKREFLLNQIREQSEEISRLMGLLESYRRKAMREEPARLSLSNTPLPTSATAAPAGSAVAAAAARPSISNGMREPPPEVRAWIEQARQSFEAIGGLIEEGAFTAASDADGEHELEPIGEDGSEGTDTEGDVSAHDELPPDSDQWSTWHDDAASPPPETSAASDTGMSSTTGTSAPSSPAMTVRSASREGSAAPSSGSGSRGGKIRRPKSGQGRRKTPQPTLPTTSAVPFGMFAALASAVEGSKPKAHAAGSRSPKGARSGSIEYEGAAVSAEGDKVLTKREDGMDEERAKDGAEGEVQVTVEVEQGEGDGSTGGADSAVKGPAYGAAAPGFFAPIRRAPNLLSASTASSTAKDANASESAGKEGSSPDVKEPSKASDNTGVSDASNSSPASVPHILARGVVGPKEVEELFKIYFDKMNLSCSLLDPILYTAQTTYMKSPFLFTVICAIASRYYPSGRPGIYEELMTYAQLAAGTALISGSKTVETVAAYILLSLYPLPKARWEEDRTWLYLGLAIRVATDINLHTTSLNPPSGVDKPENGRVARERLNRIRIWLNCYNLDRSTASWHGKASTISGRDFLAMHSEKWFASSEFNLTGFDIQIAAYNAELRALGDFKESIYGDPENPTGLKKDKNISALASDFDERLLAQEAEWNARLARETDHENDAQARFRNSLVKLAYRYARLTVLSFGFQRAFRPTTSSGTSGGAGVGSDNEEDRKPFLERCYRAATEIARLFVDELSSHKVYLRHGPEAQCVFVTFACAFLIKLLHPKYASYLLPAQRREIDTLIRGVVSLLSSPEVSVDEKHSPRLWARFLEGLLSTPMARIELPSPTSPGGKRKSSQKGEGQKQGSQYSQGGQQTQSTDAQGSTQQLFSSSGGHNGSEEGGAPLTLQYDQSIAQSHPQSQSSQTSFDLNSHDHANNSTAETFGAFGEFSTHQQHGSIPSYTHTGIDAGMYGLTSPLSSPLSGDLTSPTSLHSGVGMAGATTSPDLSNGTAASIAPNALQMHVPDFYQSPVPMFDSDLLASMQSMQDPSLWQDMPGYNWISSLQTSDTDTTMHDGTSGFLTGSVLDASQRVGAIGYGSVDSHYVRNAGQPF